MHTIAIIICLITLPIILLLYFTASKPQHARRMRRNGHSPKLIGARLGVSHQQVTAWCLV
jgi:hypothetical protein